jgi:DNA-binding NarL/FixJ family response regulator
MEEVLSAIENRRSFESVLAKHVGLSARECDVVLLVVEGLRNKEIARCLRLSEGTVKLHLHKVYGKVGVSNRTALAVWVDRMVQKRNNNRAQSRALLRIVG